MGSTVILFQAISVSVFCSYLWSSSLTKAEILAHQSYFLKESLRHL